MTPVRYARSQEARLRRWQRVTVATLLVGYTGYYLCRSNLSVAAPLMLEALGPEGFTRQTLGLIVSAGVLAYAIGKFATGVAADFLGGRAMFLIGMAGAAAATLLFGVSTSVPLFVIAWCLNRLIQSGGWGGLVKVTSHWFPARSYGTVMGAPVAQLPVRRCLLPAAPGSPHRGGRRLAADLPGLRAHPRRARARRLLHAQGEPHRRRPPHA